MYTLEELLKIKANNEELLDLPIEDFVGWDGWTAMIDSHIEALKQIEGQQTEIDWLRSLPLSNE